MNIKTILGASALALTLPSMASAAIVSVNDVLSSDGDAAAIISAPASVEDDTTTNTAQQGFNEKQNVTVTTAFNYDGGSLTVGDVVDSHMIFLNSDGNGGLTHNGVEWTFSGNIIGVMLDAGGLDEAASNDEFGAMGTLYPGAFGARGLEGNDSVSIAGNVLTVNMRVTEPGDWIRVITEASPVPVPAGLPLVLTGLGVFGFMRNRKRKAA